jgi:hypothetical protein
MDASLDTMLGQSDEVIDDTDSALSTSSDDDFFFFDNTDFWDPGWCHTYTNLDVSYFLFGGRERDQELELNLCDIKVSALETRCRGCEVLWFAVEPYVQRIEAEQETALRVRLETFGDEELISLDCHLIMDDHSLAAVEISTCTPTSEW